MCNEYLPLCLHRTKSNSAARSFTWVIGEVNSLHKEFLVVFPSSGLLCTSRRGGNIFWRKYLRMILSDDTHFKRSDKTGDNNSFWLLTSYKWGKWNYCLLLSYYLHIKSACNYFDLMLKVKELCTYWFITKLPFQEWQNFVKSCHILSFIL